MWKDEIKKYGQKEMRKTIENLLAMMKARTKTADEAKVLSSKILDMVNMQRPEYFEKQLKEDLEELNALIFQI